MQVIENLLIVLDFEQNSDMKQKSEDIEQLLQLIKAWLMKQPHLPQNIGKTNEI